MSVGCIKVRQNILVRYLLVPLPLMVAVNAGVGRVQTVPRHFTTVCTRKIMSTVPTGMFTTFITKNANT